MAEGRDDRDRPADGGGVEPMLALDGACKDSRPSCPHTRVADHGHFAYNGVGLSNRRISGSVLTLAVDAATGQVTDSGLSNGYPHLRRLGPITTDVRP